MKRKSLPPTETDLCTAIDTLRKLIDGGYLDSNREAEKVCQELQETLDAMADASGELEG